MKKKFELTNETKTVCGRTLFRIKALISFRNVSAGDLGGFVEKEENLSHCGNAWVYDNSWVYDNARVCDDAQVYGNAQVCDDAQVYGNAQVCDDAQVCGYAQVYGNAQVCGDAEVHGYAQVYGNAQVCGDARVCGDAQVCGDADYITVKGLGSQNRVTTVCKDRKLGIAVKCGCFIGSLTEFRNKVEETHGDSKFAREYLALIDLIKIHFELSKEE